MVTVWEIFSQEQKFSLIYFCRDYCVSSKANLDFSFFISQFAQWEVNTFFLGLFNHPMFPDAVAHVSLVTGILMITCSIRLTIGGVFEEAPVECRFCLSQLRS